MISMRMISMRMISMRMISKGMISKRMISKGMVSMVMTSMGMISIRMIMVTGRGQSGQENSHFWLRMVMTRITMICKITKITKITKVGIIIISSGVTEIQKTIRVTCTLRRFYARIRWFWTIIC